MRDTELYRQILQLDDEWTVEDVELVPDEGRVTIRVEYAPDGGKCPECGARTPLHDHARLRRWRHLDTCQLMTFIECRAPRADCPEHGVKTMSVPWAEPRGRFTLLFERMAISLLLATSRQNKAAECLRLSDDEVRHIKEKAVARGLARRGDRPARHLGLDEKSMKKGHNYMTVLSDLDAGCVRDVEPTRERAAAERLLQALSPAEKTAVEAVCADMWTPYRQAAEAVLPGVSVVYDRYHVSGLLGKAVDATRRAELRRLDEKERKLLKGQRYSFLYSHENMLKMSAARVADFNDAMRVARRTSVVYYFKEAFRHFWDQPSIPEARRFLENWCDRARHERIRPLTRVAKTIANHAVGLINYITHRVTNAVAEEINGKIQQLKASARGFRSFAIYRVNILFHFGGLDLDPLETQ